MIWAIAAGLMTVLAPLPTHDAVARVVQRDWTTTVNRTPSGAFVIGNPRAKVKLVEYLSLTCAHCAHFTEQAWPVLKADYIGRGLVSLEVRPAVRDGFDLTASLLAWCAGPAGYFGATESVLAKQAEWTKRAEAFSGEGIDAEPMNARLIAMAKAAGLDSLFAARGMKAPRLVACLSNPAEQKRLAATTEEAWSRIGGTPAFLINGVLQPDVSTWEALEPRLQAAVK